MYFRRFIAFVLSFVIVLSCALVPISAHESDNAGDYIFESIVVPFETMVIRSVQSIGNILDSIQDESFPLIRNVYEFWSGLYYDELKTYFDFVSGLDRPDASSVMAVTGYQGVSTVKGYLQNMWNPLHSGVGFVPVLSMCGVNDKVAVLGCTAVYFYGYYFDASGKLYMARFENPFGAVHATYLAMYKVDDLGEPNAVFDMGIYYSKSYAEQNPAFATSTLYAFDWNRTTVSHQTYTWNYKFSNVYCKQSVNSIWDESLSSFSVTVGGDFAYDIYLYYMDKYEVFDGFVTTQPTGVDSTSRVSSLMQTINRYNIDNSIEDNSANINFFLVPTGEDPTKDTAVSPPLYDEETLVYTDPVTGTEYLTNGWTYDYLTRSYTLDMADDTYLIGDTVIDTIKLTYGDELLTVDHYASGSLIRSDEYNYVMVSGSQCGLDGHTNVITDTQDPTCTADGHRTYTCSVCGNQTVETIPKTDHAYGEFTVEQDPTCTAPGIHSFTCTTCGGQYTDTIAALGHDWQPTASTEESYVMPDNVSCPECYGKDFTWTRQDLELKTGKNLFDISKLSVQPENSSGPWISEVGDNYIVLSLPEDETSEIKRLNVSCGVILGELAPSLEVGHTYVLSFDTDSSYKHINLGFSWRSGMSLTVTEDLLSRQIVFYTMNLSAGDPYGDCCISNIQIEEGTVATAYEPYDPEYVEIIPPIYTFTCSDPDCSTVWTEEAEYQGATVTYTCTRCDATRTEAAGEEAGLFHSIGNLIADGIAWVTDKLAELIDGLTVIMGNFNRYLDSVKNSGGQFPAFLAAMFGLFPEDFMNVIWFGLIGFVVLLVWKQWFS